MKFRWNLCEIQMILDKVQIKFTGHIKQNLDKLRRNLDIIQGKNRQNLEEKLTKNFDKIQRKFR